MHVPLYSSDHFPESSELVAGLLVGFTASSCSTHCKMSFCCSMLAVLPRLVLATALLRSVCTVIL